MVERDGSDARLRPLAGPGTRRKHRGLVGGGEGRRGGGGVDRGWCAGREAPRLTSHATGFGRIQHRDLHFKRLGYGGQIN